MREEGCELSGERSPTSVTNDIIDFWNGNDVRYVKHDMAGHLCHANERNSYYE